MKKNLVWLGLGISGVILVIMLISDVCRFLSQGYFVDVNSITGSLVIFAHVIMVMFFLFFALMLLKTRVK